MIQRIVLTATFAFVASAANAALVISNNPTSNMSCVSGVCTSTSSNAVLNAGDLQTLLASSNVSVVTASGANTIAVNAPVTWNAFHLTFDSTTGFSASALMSVTAHGGLTITTNDGGSGGDIGFSNGGKLNFTDLSSNVVLNGETYLLESNIAPLISAINAAPDGHFALAQDIALTKAYRRSPVIALNGVLEGFGHVVTKLKVKSKRQLCLGLIAELGGKVRNLALTNAAITDRAAQSSAGALAGCAEIGSAIVNVSMSGSVTGSSGSAIGGVVGRSSGGIRNANASGTFSGDGSSGATSMIGGVVGSSDGSVTNSSSSGTIQGGTNSYAGGLAGSADDVSLSWSGASVAVAAGRNSRAGGLVGFGSADTSFAIGVVSVGDSGTAGGLIGQGLATNSYAINSVHLGANGAWGGGLIGTGKSSLLSYAATAFVFAIGAGDSVGGFIGLDKKRGSNSDVYWDTDIGGSQGAGNNVNDPGLTGLTDAQLKSGLPAGFDPSIWGHSVGVNNGYPYLLANPPQ